MHACVMMQSTGNDTESEERNNDQAAQVGVLACLSEHELACLPRILFLSTSMLLKQQTQLS